AGHRDVARLWNSGPGTLVHGDPHMGNLFVDTKDGDRTGFLDWAVIGRSPGLRDIAYVLCNSVPHEVRARNERVWLDRYCELLDDAGIELTAETAWEQYRLFPLYSCFSAPSPPGI